MCGVVGIHHYADPDARVDPRELAAMSELVRHRGPDGDGTFLEGNVGLAHRRLAIVDLSKAGHQPMASSDGACVVSYNGEIYNHRELRARLGEGHAFRGSSDTETLVELVARRGPDAIAEANGIFAFAMWDRRARRLLLARDPLGVKQLYFHDDGRRIVFASEIKALFACAGVPRALDPVALNEYLHFHTPLFDRTLFAGISQVMPGEWIERRSAARRSRIYFRLDDRPPARFADDDQVAALRAEIARAVGAQMMSDVPVGAFFSGGIDSSAIAAHARQHTRELPCFGVHFTDQGVVDERPYQEAAAAALGVPLHLVTIDGERFPEDLAHLTWHQDQPVIGAAMLPMFHVSRLASRSVKVCLGGQAADELFGGYGRHALLHPARALAALGQRALRARRSAPGGGTDVGGNLVRQLLERRTIARLARAGTALGDPTQLYFEVFAKVPERAWRDLFAEPALVSRAVARATLSDFVARSPFRDPADRVLHWEVSTYLPGLFQQDDRMSMACSLESRVPFADPRLVRAAFRVPFDLKVRDGASKWILRRAVADVLPPTVLTRRKVGFDTPADAWMRGRHREFVRDLLLSKIARERGWLAPGAVERLLARERDPHWFDLLWKIVSLEVWARTFLDGGAAPRGAGAPRHA